MSRYNPIVLVVDDEPAILTLVSAILRGAGYKVLSAGSARRAIEMFREYRPDLVLTDIIMPDMSGTELVQHMHQSDSGARFLLMTGYSEEDLKDYLQGLGGPELPLLHKPFAPPDLLAHVRQALESPAATHV